jgi:hypothetical protein
LTSLDLHDSPPLRNVIPLASRLETSSIEMVLSTLLATLEVERFQYIGLFATDLQDRIFLAEEIRHHLPNTALFTLSGDLIYLHPDVNLDLRGTQVIASYPLFSANQAWTPSSESRILFAAHTAQGVYNAALALLDKPERMQEYGFPFDRSKQRPPLWLSVVGSNNVWPVHLLGEVGGIRLDEVPGTYMYERKPPSPAGNAGQSFRTPNNPWVPTLVLLFCLVPAIVLLGNLTPGLPATLRNLLGAGPVGVLFSDVVFRSHWFERRLYLFACFAALFSVYLVTVTLFLLPAVPGWSADRFVWESAWSTQLFQCLMVIGIPVMAATLGVLSWSLWHAGNRGKGASLKWRRFATVCVGLSSAVLLLVTMWMCWTWLHSAWRAPAEAVFLYLRGSNFGSGVSPLLPLLLLGSAGAVWSVSSLRRLRLLEGPDQYIFALAPDPPKDTDRVPNSFLGFEGRSFEGVTRLERDVMNAIGRQASELPVPALGGTLCLLLVVWWRLFIVRSLPTVEGTAFDTLFALGFLLIYTALAFSFLRFISVWLKLRRLLQRLAWHPTVEAYDRLRKSIPGKPKINLTSPSQVFTALEFSVDRAGKLVALARRLCATGEAGKKFTLQLGGLLDSLQGNVETAELELHAALEAQAAGDWREMTKRRTHAERSLSTITSQVTGLLRSGWRLPPTAVPEPGEKKPDEQQWFEYGEDFLTSRVAAFLSHVVPQLQNLVVFVTVGLLLVLFATTSYPFQPRQLLLLFNTATILVVVSATLIVFVQMERDTVLSVLSESEPGQITWNRDFVLRIIVYVVLPILSVLGAQFPEVVRQLFTSAGSLLGGHS